MSWGVSTDWGEKPKKGRDPRGGSPQGDLEPKSSTIRKKHGRGKMVSYRKLPKGPFKGEP